MPGHSSLSGCRGRTTVCDSESRPNQSRDATQRRNIKEKMSLGVFWGCRSVQVFPRSLRSSRAVLILRAHWVPFPVWGTDYRLRQPSLWSCINTSHEHEVQTR
jgi:hypothetical protein